MSTLEDPTDRKIAVEVTRRDLDDLISALVVLDHELGDGSMYVDPASLYSRLKKISDVYTKGVEVQR